jgi:hypothetical protein
MPIHKSYPQVRELEPTQWQIPYCNSAGTSLVVGSDMSYDDINRLFTFSGLEFNLNFTINEAKLGTQPNGNDDDSIATVKYVDDVLAGGGGTLSALADTDVADRVNGDLLVYRPTLGDWQATTLDDDYVAWGASGPTTEEKGTWSIDVANGLLRRFIAVDTYWDFYNKDEVDCLIGGVSNFEDLDDVNFTSLSDLQFARFDNGTSKWLNVTLELDMNSDVSLSDEQDFDFLAYNSNLSVWKNTHATEAYVPSASITDQDSEGEKGQWSYEDGKLYYCIASDTWVELTATTSFTK